MIPILTKNDTTIQDQHTKLTLLQKLFAMMNLLIMLIHNYSYHYWKKNCSVAGTSVRWGKLYYAILEYAEIL